MIACYKGKGKGKGKGMGKPWYGSGHSEIDHQRCRTEVI
jgi:hypothetical protein